MSAIFQRMLIHHQWVCSLTFDSGKTQWWVKPAGVSEQTHTSSRWGRFENFSSAQIRPITVLNWERVFLYSSTVLNILWFSLQQLNWSVSVLLQQTTLTATLFSLHPDHSSLEFPNRPCHDGDGTEGWEFSCSGPNCCQDRAPPQHERYECSAAVDRKTVALAFSLEQYSRLVFSISIYL